MTSPLLFVTSSASKFAEARRVCPVPLERVEADLVEPQSLDVGSIVRAKAAAAWSLFGRPLVVEDTSLELSALGGFPGPLVKWLLASAGPAAIPKMIAPFGDCRALARAVIGFADGNRLLVFHGSVPGTIVAPRGEGGFGWDVVFQPEGFDRTFAELPAEEKDRISHRARAFVALGETLARIGPEA
jgi:non-canonical purine NTP pyrophosphatase (RdgB/HAM1 family)